METKIKHIETRWAFVMNFNFGQRLLGKFCWRDNQPNEPTIRTYPTREKARLAKSECCYQKSKIVKIFLETQEQYPRSGSGSRSWSQS